MGWGSCLWKDSLLPFSTTAAFCFSTGAGRAFAACRDQHSILRAHPQHAPSLPGPVYCPQYSSTVAAEPRADIGLLPCHSAGKDHPSAWPLPSPPPHLRFLFQLSFCLWTQQMQHLEKRDTNRSRKGSWCPKS